MHGVPGLVAPASAVAVAGRAASAVLVAELAAAAAAAAVAAADGVNGVAVSVSLPGPATAGQTATLAASAAAAIRIASSCCDAKRIGGAFTQLCSSPSPGTKQRLPTTSLQAAAPGALPAGPLNMLLAAAPAPLRPVSAVDAERPGSSTARSRSARGLPCGSGSGGDAVARVFEVLVRDKAAVEVAREKVTCGEVPEASGGGATPVRMCTWARDNAATAAAAAAATSTAPLDTADAPCPAAGAGAAGGDDAAAGSGV